jgi:hypothetical protein
LYFPIKLHFPLISLNTSPFMFKNFPYNQHKTLIRTQLHLFWVYRTGWFPVYSGMFFYWRYMLHVPSGDTRSKILNDTIQLSPLLECDPTVCLPEKSKVTRGLVRGWPNFSRGDTSSGHTPTRVIIGKLYRILLHQTPSNRIPVALRKYSI